MLKREMNIADYDAELWQAMEQEKVRQEEHIELIASENYTSPRVMQAQGSQLTNKYAEGYPGKRYYGGCEVVDQSEQIAIDRLKQILISLNNWRSIVRKNCSALTTLTSSRTPAPRLTLRSTPRCWNQAIPFWV